MPINYRDYHPLWKRISRFVRLIRARHHCEDCGVENYSVGYWHQGDWHPCEPTFDNFKEAADFRNQYNALNRDCLPTVSVIVLTVAHLDHDVTNNELDNLKALCQRCHLTHDRKDNALKRMYGPTGRHHNQLKLEL